MGLLLLEGFQCSYSGHVLVLWLLAEETLVPDVWSQNFLLFLMLWLHNLRFYSVESKKQITQILRIPNSPQAKFTSKLNRWGPRPGRKRRLPAFLEPSLLGWRGSWDHPGLGFSAQPVPGSRFSLQGGSCVFPRGSDAGTSRGRAGIFEIQARPSTYISLQIILEQEQILYVF